MYFNCVSPQLGCGSSEWWCLLLCISASSQQLGVTWGEKWKFYMKMMWNSKTTLAILIIMPCFFHLSVSFRAPLTSGTCFSISIMSPWLAARAAATSALSSSCRLGCLASSYSVHSSVMDVWNKNWQQSTLFKTHMDKFCQSHLFFTVSTPPAISSVMLAFMSSMESLSSMSRLARTPGYFFWLPVSWRNCL